MSWIEDPGLSEFRGVNISQLNIDEAWVNVTSLVADTALWIYELSTDCHKCPYERKSALNYSNPYLFVASTKFGVKYRIRTRDSEQYVREGGHDSFKFCDISETQTSDFGEFGVHNILIGGSQRDPECRVETALNPVNIYYPLLLAFLFYLVFGTLIFLVTKCHKRLQYFLNMSQKSSSSSSSKSSSASADPHPPGNGIERPGEIESHPSYPPPNPIYGHTVAVGGRRASTASISGNGNGQVIYGTTGNGNIGQGHGHPNGVYGYHNHQQQSPAGTTEVSISTISSTPTSTSVTTFAEPPQHLHHQAHGVPQSASGDNGRKPINPATTANSTSTSANANANNSSQTPRQKPRLRSLDTFRGMCIVIMIFVNDGGGAYPFFEHATWDGLYVADLVFPWFLWIMGVCIPVSIKSQVKRGNSRFTILKRIFIRSCKLILLGILLGSLWGPVDIHTMRIPGVLQRFGICYFVACVLVLFCMTINITKPEASKVRAALQDVQIIWIAWLLVLMIVLLWCCLTFFLEVPGCPTGYLGPGGLHDYYFEPYRTIPSHCIGGAAGYIDREVMQVRHIYQYPTALYRYKAEAYDPEGILGLLTSIFQVWLGVQTGVTMLVYPRPWSRIKRWGAWALISGALGALLCGCKQTGGWIPLNKNIWSLSFVLVTNCFALVLLAVLYFVIDMKHWWSGSPFFEPGMNSILLYVGHSVANRMLPWHYVYGPMRTHFSRLVESLWGTSLWVVIAVYLYHKKIFWTV